MAVSFVASGAAGIQTVAGNLSITPGLPAGVAEGDLLVASVLVRMASTTDPAVSTPAGWTFLGGAFDTGGGSGVAIRTYVRSWTSGVTAPNFTTSVSISSARAGILALRDAVVPTSGAMVSELEAGAAANLRTTSSISVPADGWLVASFGARSGETWASSDLTDRSNGTNGAATGATLFVGTKGPLTAGTYSTSASMDVASSVATKTILAITPAVVAAPVSGSASTPLPAFTSAATGTHVAPGATGTATTALPAFTTSAAGTRTIPPRTGAASTSLPPFTSSASGSFTPPVPATPTGVTADPGATTIDVSWTPSPGATSYTVEWEQVTTNVTGAAATTLPPFTSSSTGTHTPPPTRTGAATTQLPAFTSSATGVHVKPTSTGTASTPLPAFTSSATGTFVKPVRSGTATTSLPAFATTAAGTRTVPTSTGAAVTSLPTFTTQAAGAFAVFVPIPDDAKTTHRPANRATTTHRPVSAASTTHRDVSAATTTHNPAPRATATHRENAWQST